MNQAGTKSYFSGFREMQTLSVPANAVMKSENYVLSFHFNNRKWLSVFPLTVPAYTT